MGSGAFVDAHPELVQRLLEAQQQAVQWLSDESNKQAYIQLVSGLASYPPVILERDLQDEVLGQTFRSSLDQPFLDQLQASVDLAAEQRLIRKPFKVSQWLAPQATRPAPAALAADRG
ncbi:hypothetical protein D3C76_924490 [compost metagenome]